jgi:hypothetical protein
MATSKAIRRPWAVGAAAVSLLALAVTAVLIFAGSPRAHDATGATASAGPPGASTPMAPTAGAATAAGPRSAAGFSWLAPATAPAGWTAVTTSSTHATLFYPPGWKPIAGDRGTVSAALFDRHHQFAGYLNVTPRQGAERLHGWSAFRLDRNREEGDTQVHRLASAEGLAFRDARGSCVIDDYVSHVAGHHYREIACLVAGHRATDVFIGAALRRDWPRVSPTLEGAASAFVAG